jgi:hypothetical protein
MRTHTQRLSPMLMSVVVSVVLLACSGKDASIASEPTDDPLASPPAAVPDTFYGRAYLPNVLPSAKDLNGYAGYVLNVFGTRAENGVCQQDPARLPVLDPISYLARGTQLQTEPIGDIITNILVRKGAVATGGFLSFVTVDMTDSMRAEVVVEDLARQSAADKLDAVRLGALARTAPRQGVCAREVVIVAQVTSFKTRKYTEVVGKTKLAGYGVAVDGKLFGSGSAFNNRYRLFIESRPIDAYAGPAPKPDTAAPTIKRIRFGHVPLLRPPAR